MTEPEQDRLTAARMALHAGLRATFQALADTEPPDTVAGWHVDRVHPFVPRQVVAPAGWIDVPTVHQSPTAQSRAQSATFPVFVALDGEDHAQSVAQDRVLAFGWDALSVLEVPGLRFTVQTAGPGEVDVGGATQRGVVFSVQVQLLRTTWCSSSIVPTATP